MTTKNWPIQLASFKPGKKVTLSLFRNQHLIEKQLTLGKLAKKPVGIEPMTSASDKQKAFFKAWLGVDFPIKKLSEEKAK